uniref:C2H2-type domain-containing protein n=1 Tax=Aegilops tauschii subsp. strangulata TaxID=200361 RepID=A0A453IR65_AEGTS
RFCSCHGGRHIVRDGQERRGAAAYAAAASRPARQEKACPPRHARSRRGGDRAVAQDADGDEPVRVCEICNKGFQRDQNLQLHRRGHNLPWKLRQRSGKEVRKRVYVCPEPSCVHHDPSRALGDLTGIKKHFCRKHGEKKWKCDKCSKKYAVQSDWKAHAKTCGSREYRCDCGTLFSRRDSFITHRAFCDALAEESAKARAPPPEDGSSGAATFCLCFMQSGRSAPRLSPSSSTRRRRR